MPCMTPKKTASYDNTVSAWPTLVLRQHAAMTPKRVIFLLVAAVTSTAPMHPICRRFADDQGVPTFPAQYICSDDHSQGLDEFCLSTLEWHTHGGLWSSAHGAGSIINDAEQGPSALADHHGSLLHDTVKAYRIRPSRFYKCLGENL